MKKSIMVTMVMLIALSICAFAFTPLGSIQHPGTLVLSSGNLSGKTAENINLGVATKDVTKMANVTAIFGTGATVTMSAIRISGANGIGDKWIEISNQGATSSNLTGWALRNKENLTYTFPIYVLNTGSMVRIYGGMGAGNDTALFTNAAQPLINDTADVITLLDASGAVVDKYEFGTSAPISAISTRGSELQSILINDNSNRNPELTPILINDNFSKNPEKASLLINSSS